MSRGHLGKTKVHPFHDWFPQVLVFSISVDTLSSSWFLWLELQVPTTVRFLNLRVDWSMVDWNDRHDLGLKDSSDKEKTQFKLPSGLSWQGYLSFSLLFCSTVSQSFSLDHFLALKVLLVPSCFLGWCMLRKEISHLTRNESCFTDMNEGIRAFVVPTIDLCSLSEFHFPFIEEYNKIQRSCSIFPPMFHFSKRRPARYSSPEYWRVEIHSLTDKDLVPLQDIP